MEEIKKFIRPYKINRQKYESAIDVHENVAFMADIIKGSDSTGDIAFISDTINHPEKIMIDSATVSAQILEKQRGLDIEEKGGRLLYPVIYKFNKDEYDMSFEEGQRFAAEMIHKYDKFPSMAVVTENEDNVSVNLLYSNYSADGEKMTKKFNPSKATSIYKKMQKQQANGS